LGSSTMNSPKPQAAGLELADVIEQEVWAGKYPPGAVLGFETDLMARHETGRAVVRQAVRILEQRGIAYSRRGKRGGLVVAEPRPDSAIRALSIVIGSQFVDFTDISGLISASDNHYFLNCAAKVDPAACRELQERVNEFEAMSAEEFLRLRGHKQVMDSFLNAFADPAASLAQHTANTCGRDLIPDAMGVFDARQRGEFWEITRLLVDAQLAGNVSQLFELRMRQWRLFAALWSRIGNLDRVHDRITSKVTAARGSHVQTSGSGAERLAREILRDIRHLGWRAGERIGRSDELISRYGSSPNLLRQAVCILEEYSAAKMQRGRTAGLVITIPDEEVAIHRAVAYLRWAGARPADVHRFLIQICLEALNRSPHTTDRKRLPELRAAIDRRRASGGKSAHQAKQEPYLAVTRLSNNPALQLFARVLTAYLSDKLDRRAAQDVDGSAFLDEMLDSVIAGNIPRACRAFLQYASLDFPVRESK
jgi:DNA-binding FadR family transcriptional regulator